VKSVHAEGSQEGGIAPPFLISALDRGEWSASRPDRFIPEERTPDTHWINGWLGPRAGLDSVETRKFSCPCRKSNPGCPGRRFSTFSNMLVQTNG
jgi:hypothetical protein